MTILVVLTSHDELGNTGRKTGFWLEEFAAPYYVFKDAGIEMTLASPKGGQPPLDPKSDDPDAQTDATRRFKRIPTRKPRWRIPRSLPPCRPRTMTRCSIPVATAHCGISPRTRIPLP